MLELALFVLLGKTLYNLARAKGRSGAWALLGPVLVLASEVGTGHFVVRVLGFEGQGPIYGTALAGGLVGGGVAYLIVRGLESVEPAA